MRKEVSASLVAGLLVLMTACGKQTPTSETRTADGTATESPDSAQPSSTTGPQPKPGGGLSAEPSDVAGTLAITIKWSARIVKGIPNEGLATTVYNRSTQLVCPLTSGGESAYSYFATLDNPNGDPFAATGSYQPWFNEDCTGTLTIDDSYHQDDPTLAGPEPVVRTTGTQPLSTGDTPLTVETDLGRTRTRYMFIAPSTGGFQQEASASGPARLVPASAAPMARLDFTLDGPIGDGKQEVAVEGGTLQVDWTFSRGAQP